MSSFSSAKTLLQKQLETIAEEQEEKSPIKDQYKPKRKAPCRSAFIDDEAMDSDSIEDDDQCVVDQSGMYTLSAYVFSHPSRVA